jgi:hypothetical protein
MGKRRKQPRQRIPKEERHNLRFWAQGAREEVLAPHLEAYSGARDTGWVAERAYLQTVCNEFHARVDWRLEDHEEPILKLFDATTLIEREELTPEEEAKRGARVELLNAVSARAENLTWLMRLRCPAHSQMVHLPNSLTPPSDCRSRPG